MDNTPETLKGPLCPSLAYSELYQDLKYLIFNSEPRKKLFFFEI